LDVLIVGGPSDFIETLEQFQALGTTHVLIRFMVPTQEHILRAIQIIGERVLPQIS
jgi:alkanesulfonate monooxygenase SsuD/methylene tetrahydromethanopterin reductase-like flavin-dependent oxidoreductase (luciferase family)